MAVAVPTAIATAQGQGKPPPVIPSMFVSEEHAAEYRLPFRFVSMLTRDEVLLLERAFLRFDEEDDGCIPIDKTKEVVRRVKHLFPGIEELMHDWLTFKDAEESDEVVQFLRFVERLVNDRSDNLTKQFGKRVCVVDHIPLPRCCPNPACRANHTSAPGDEKRDDLDDETAGHLFTLFKRWDRMDLGSVVLEDVRTMIDELGIVYQPARFEHACVPYRGRTTITFNEFTDILQSLDIHHAVTNVLGDSYAISDDIRALFTEEDIESMRHHFSLFDIDGNGNIDADELVTIMNRLGTPVDRLQAQVIIKEFDTDQSGSIEFGEFLMIMHKIRQGLVDVGASALAQAVMDSKLQVIIADELDAINKDPVECATVIGIRDHPPAAHIVIQGPPGTPYEGAEYLLHATVTQGYPYRPPHTGIKGRVLHPNIITKLDGNSAMMHLKDVWNSGWTFRQLLEHVVELFREPNLALVPYEMQQCVPHFPMDEEEEEEEEDGDWELPEEWLRSLSRVEQLHLNVLNLYVNSREQFDALVRQSVVEQISDRDFEASQAEEAKERAEREAKSQELDDMTA